MFNALKGKELILVFDLDGVLVPYGEKNVPPVVKTVLGKLPIVKAIASGKPLSWCSVVAMQVNADFIFAENALVYQLRDNAPVLTSDIRGIERLKQLIKFQVLDEERWSAEVTLNRVTSQMVFEPGKSVLTLWAEPRKKAKQFESALCAWSEKQFLEQMRELISLNGLSDTVQISGPCLDGAIDFQPIGIDKGKAIDVLKDLFPMHQIVVFVDDTNDIPMASRNGVFAVTFGNASEAIRKLVEEKRSNGEGCIIPKAGYDDGLEEALQLILSERGGKNGEKI